MNCPNCGTSDFYEGISPAADARQCRKRGCRYFHPRAEELHGSPTPPAVEGTRRFLDVNGRVGLLRVVHQGRSYAVRDETWLEHEPWLYYPREQVEGWFADGTWKWVAAGLPPQVGQNLVPSHQWEVQPQVGLAQGVDPGLPLVGARGDKPPCVFVSPYAYQAMADAAHDVGVAGGVAGGGVGVQGEGDAQVIQLTGEQFRQAVRDACLAGVEHYVDRVGWDLCGGGSIAVRTVQRRELAGEVANVAWERVAAEAGLQTAGQAVAEECNGCNCGPGYLFLKGKWSHDPDWTGLCPFCGKRL